MCLKEFSARALSSSDSSVEGALTTDLRIKPSPKFCARNSGKISEFRDPVSSPWFQLPSSSHDSLQCRAVSVSVPRCLAVRVVPSLKEIWDSSGAGCLAGDTIPCFKSRWGPYIPGTTKRLLPRDCHPSQSMLPEHGDHCTNISGQAASQVGMALIKPWAFHISGI